MNWRFWTWLRTMPQAPNPAPAPPAPPRRRRMVISPEAVAAAGPAPAPPEKVNVFKLPAAPPGVIPKEKKMAVDAAMDAPYQFAAQQMNDLYAEGLAFMGYPALAELALRAEYRRPAEILAKEMTRKWIKLQSTGTEKPQPKPPKPPPAVPPGMPGQMPPGAAPPAAASVPPGAPPAQAQDFAPPGVPPQRPPVPQNGAAGPPQAHAVPPNGQTAPPGLPAAGAPAPTAEEPEPDPKAEKLVRIEAELERLGAQDCFKRALEQDGFFGRSQIFIDTGAEDGEELKLPLSETVDKIKASGIKRLVVIEPTWTYPDNYNSTDPLKPDFYKPSSWFVLGKRVHSSRLMTVISREVPDMLKPAYAFGGLPLTQMIKPYVDNWLRTRQSVSDLLHSFTVSVLSTDMSSVMGSDLGGMDTSGLANPYAAGAGADLFTRVDFFNRVRDNRGCMVLDKDHETFENVSAPLSGLHELQAQSQEHMSAAAGIPLVHMTGITPSGLNASSDGEISVFQDRIGCDQEAAMRPHLERLIRIIQLDLFGEIDPEIGFIFNPLRSIDEAELATVRKTEADTDAVYIGQGVLDPHESRVRLAAQEDSPYASLDLTVDPEPPEPPGGDPMMGGFPPGAGGPGEEDDGADEPDAGPPGQPPPPRPPQARPPQGNGTAAP